jgi:hypothetical protein
VSDQTETDNTASLARTLLTETREELAKADQKASLLMGALGVALAAFAGAAGSAAIRPYSYSVPGQILFWSGCAVAAVSVALFGAAVRPRLGFNPAGRIHYFGDVADGHRTLDEIRAELSVTDPVGRDVAQLVALARIVTVKYRNIRHGITSGAVGMVLLAAGVLIG